MVIGIDIDDTILISTESFNKILHRDELYKDVEDYHTLEKEVYEKFLKEHIREVCLNQPIIDDVVETLNYFKEKGIKLVFITARNNILGGLTDMTSITSVIFASYNIPCDKIIFMQDKKGKIALQEKCDLFIDDKERVLDEIKEYGIKTLRFSPKDVESNHQIVKSWLEVKTYVEDLLGGKNE